MDLAKLAQQLSLEVSAPLLVAVWLVLRLLSVKGKRGVSVSILGKTLVCVEVENLKDTTQEQQEKEKTEVISEYASPKMDSLTSSKQTAERNLSRNQAQNVREK